MSEENSQRGVKVTLAAPHKHRGIIHPEGTELELRPDRAERLYKGGVLQRKPQGIQTTDS